MDPVQVLSLSSLLALRPSHDPRLIFRFAVRYLQHCVERGMLGGAAGCTMVRQTRNTGRWRACGTVRAVVLFAVVSLTAQGCWYSSNKDIAGPDVATDSSLDPGTEDAEPSPCPEGMASVLGEFCMDRFEASRPDATAISQGEETGPASSVAGVMPWRTSSGADGYAAAQQACQEAGKRLCTAEEWSLACAGPEGRLYAYGDEYDPAICNGIDAFCPDPYPFCGLELGGFHLVATGEFSGCVSPEGIHDINGNLWEWIQGDDLQVKGGAYNCGDSATLHACTYSSPAAYRSAVGFRCCSDL